MHVTLSSHLRELKTRERQRSPEKRRSIPTMVELAQEIGVHPVTLSEWANDHTDYINKAGFAAIIAALRRRGFETDVPDLIVYLPPAGNNGNQDA